MRRVAILCASTGSVYHTLRGLDVYDPRRDAWTFPGGMPCIAHPPCRTWSALCSHQVKLSEEDKSYEQALGLLCAEAVKACGGILEQPAHSRLFEAAGLPLPNEPGTDDSWSAVFDQAWWGFMIRKRTWLYFRGIPRQLVQAPLVLRDPPPGYDHWVWSIKKNMGGYGGARSATPPAFARWLVNLARQANVPEVTRV